MAKLKLERNEEINIEITTLVLPRTGKIKENFGLAAMSYRVGVANHKDTGSLSRVIEEVEQGLAQQAHAKGGNAVINLKQTSAADSLGVVVTLLGDIVLC
jgi:hypothetical protein